MQIDFTSVEYIRKWFEENKGLSTIDLAMLAHRSAGTIRAWKRRAGVKLAESPFIGTSPIKKPKHVTVIDDPRIWDNAEWFRKKYVDERVGTPTLARMINRSIAIIVKRLKRFGIKRRSLNEAARSTSKLCCESWLKEHYVDKGWPLAKCADAAGVVPYSIYNWLIKFGIEPRSMHQAMAGERNPFYGKKHSAQTREKIRQSILKRQTVKP